MNKRLLGVATAVMVAAFGLTACTNTNSNVATTNTNANMATPAATVTPTPENSRGSYTEKQAQAERERAKANKETIGDTLDDAWIHTKIVAKLITNSTTPEHSATVAELADRCAGALGLADRPALRTAALLHDVGRVGVPNALRYSC